MSAQSLALIQDHQSQHEREWSEDCIPISAESGGRSVSATRTELHKGRVVFAPDVPLWVYRSYPLAITPRPGPASEARVPAWHIRGIFVEPFLLKDSDDFSNCSVVYAVWPNAASWWEAAPFTLRHPDNVLRYDRLFTSLLPFPNGCEVSLEGHLREIPVVGHLRDGITDRRRVDTDGIKVNVRSALMLDPLRLATDWTTGRRSRGHFDEAQSGESVPDGAELWHWSVVEDLDGCLTELLRDPELVRFRESVSKDDFLLRWYRSANDTIPVPLGSPEDWTDELRARWILSEEFRDEHFVENLLEEAARYALAGPRDYQSYLARCQGWAKTGRRNALMDSEIPLVFPLVQNIYVDWLDSLQKRTATRETILSRQFLNRSAHPQTGRKGNKRKNVAKGIEAHWQWSAKIDQIQDAKQKLRLSSPSQLAHDLTRALLSLPDSLLRPESDPEKSTGKRSLLPNPADGDPLSCPEACLVVAAAAEVLEESLFRLGHNPDLAPEVRQFITWLKTRRNTAQ